MVSAPRNTKQQMGMDGSGVLGLGRKRQIMEEEHFLQCRSG